jgi:predicted enzyme related to lactoylglutathione lyase
MVMTDGQQLLGRPLWYELRTTDMKAAESFYTTIVGWAVAPFEGSANPYDMWMRAGNTPVGGVMSVPDGMKAPPHWMMFIGVPKLEDAAAQIRRLGGSTLSPLIEVPEVGRVQTMQDPQGGAFSIFEPSPKSPAMPEAMPEPGDVSWHELYTTDDEGALRFYSTLFGWRETQAMDMGPAGKYHIFARQWDLGGIMKKTKEMEQVPTHWNLYFRVPDIQAATAKVTGNGGKILMGPMDVPGGDRVVICMDPQGAAFSLHEKRS